MLSSTNTLPEHHVGSNKQENTTSPLFVLFTPLPSMNSAMYKMHFLELIVSKMCLKGCAGVCSIFNSLALLQRPSQEQCFEVTEFTFHAVQLLC